jgi:acetate kinase
MSHKYVAIRAGELLNKKKPNVITCHLGNGVSLTAVKKGESIDTSMGLTPLEGVMMGTRTGDFDPAVLQYLVKRYKFKYDELFDIANHKSGLLGISGVSKDMRIIHGRAKKGNERCNLAIEMYCYRIAKYIGAYAVALKKVDAIVFTAGAGMNAPYVRKEICDYLKILGIKINSKKNNKAVGNEAIISSPDSKIKVFVIPTDEELMIARQAVEVIKK